jgi:hypothetical protein
VYEYTHRQFGLDAFAVSGLTVSGLWTRGNLHNDGALRLGVGGKAANIYTSDTGKHSVYLRTGSSLRNFECLNRYHNTEDSYVVYNEDTPAGEGITIINGYIHSTAFDVNADGIYGHFNTSGTFGAVQITNVSAANLNRALHLDESTGAITVTGGTITGSRNSVFAEAVGTSPILSGLTITNQNVGGNNIEVYTSGGGIAIDHLTTSGLVGDTVYANASNQTVTLTNSTLGAAVGHALFSAGGGTFTASGNTYGAISDHFYSFQPTTTVHSDYNTFKNPTGRGQYAFQVNGTNYTWAAWRAIPQDANSTAN